MPVQTQAPVQVVRSFLNALAAGDTESAVALVDDNIVYTNVPLPPIRGRARLTEVLGPLAGKVGFQVLNRHVAVDVDDDGVVLTERIDALDLGPVHWQFWVYGRFEVRDGHITVWRDSFDFADLLVGLVRGVVGTVLPGAARRFPER